MMRNNNYNNSIKKWSQLWRSLFLAMILIFSSFLILSHQSLKISSAEYYPSSTEGIDNDFINGTMDNVLLYKTCKGNELRLNMYDDCTWLNVTPSIRPAPRTLHMMASVYGTDKIVLYGGIYRWDRWYNDTWVYDKSENTWTQKFPINSPGNRSESPLVAIWGTDKVMMFGGANSNGPWGINNDTWIYDLSDNNWTRKYPTNQPEKVVAHSMASFYCTDKVLLFGGYGSPYRHFNDTWIYDLSDNNWTNITTDPIPHANSFYEMSFIHNTDKVVLFGGKYMAAPPNEKNLTWIFDLSEKKWINTKPINSPEPREDLSMVPIYGTDKIFIFGGRSMG